MLNDFDLEGEPECTCWFSGDQADASDCEAHGGYRRCILPAGHSYGHMLVETADPRPLPGECPHGQQMAFEFQEVRKPQAVVSLLSLASDLMLDEGVA